MVVGDYVFGTSHIPGHEVQHRAHNPASRNVPSLSPLFFVSLNGQRDHGAVAIPCPAGWRVSQSEFVVSFRAPCTYDTGHHPPGDTSAVQGELRKEPGVQLVFAQVEASDLCPLAVQI